MSLERINVANTNSLFDDFSHLVFNAESDDATIEVVKEDRSHAGKTERMVTEIRFYDPRGRFRRVQ